MTRSIERSLLGPCPLPNNSYSLRLSVCPSPVSLSTPLLILPWPLGSATSKTGSFRHWCTFRHSDRCALVHCMQLLLVCDASNTSTRLAQDGILTSNFSPSFSGLFAPAALRIFFRACFVQTFPKPLTSRSMTILLVKLLKPV
jgi:hypothetical protein